MSVYRLGAELVFPHPEQSDPSGLLAVGGDLSPARLLLAYAAGIFPWYGPGQPILWHSPDPRAVLRPAALHVPKSLGKTLRRRVYEIRLDSAFEAVIRHCAEAPRPEGEGTWITPEMIDAYVELHRLGFAHSAEAWLEGRLVGGCYGVSLGRAFFGESMFAGRPDASKAAFCALTDQLRRWDFELIDCQVHTQHLERFVAELWPRSDFLAALQASLAHPTRRGAWRLEPAAPEPGRPVGA
jgi:leucyl/phenylalanyl-tRNA---protein transferase